MSLRRDALGLQHGALAVDLDRLHVLVMSASDVLPADRMRALLDRELRELAVALQVHFGFEELGGYMIEEIEAAPGVARQAAKLEAQHRTLVAQLERLVESASHHDLEDLKRAVARLLGVLGEHERAEIRLVLEAVDRDFGVGD